MAIIEPLPGLAVFESVARGSVAPEWVRSGIVTAWGISGAVEVELIVLSENVTFKVAVANQPTMVVRLGRPGYAADTNHIRSELTWIDALRQHDIPTPGPVRGIDGELVQSLHDETGAAWSAVAFGYVTGRVLEESDDVAPHFTEIGRLTARLHDHAVSWTRPESFSRFEWDFSDLMGPTARWGDWRDARLDAGQLRILEQAEVSARSVLRDAGIDRSPSNFGLIHSDLRPSNVLIADPADDALVIIDFDDCGLGYYLYDFAAALTFYEHRPVAQEMAARWLDGYRELRALTAAQLQAAAAFSMLRRLTMLGWATTHRSDALPPDLWEENLPGTVEVAARFLADPRWIIHG
jgi:Ser/Thr protein kinase RdoA (MazF antagonist)